ncbi:long chain fatty acid-CoA synthetase [Mycolicibacterium sp.]|jgi:hypothetical protein|uniref:long chain fatty acid-CoA synthetase n=1 Tax=Mycolicibacterium sp. TaxID=2320850 RepID=UPI0028AC51D7|nr:long chain fatty acid-CoA synthetase [Mycolicibacterium sp.]
MHTLQRTRTRAAAAHRTARAQRVLRPVGQCFEIQIDHQIDHDGGRWMIRIPEIRGAAEASCRSAVEATARECIAALTGIPLGYISVWVRD